MSENQSTSVLDQLLATLDAAADKEPKTFTGNPDAITLKMAKERRKTNVTSVRDDPVMEAFRQELTDGLIRVDTVQKVISLVNTVVQKVLL